MLGGVLALAACGRDILWFQLCYNHLQNEGFFRIRKGLLMWITKTATDIYHPMGLVHLSLVLPCLVPCSLGRRFLCWAHSLAPPQVGNVSSRTQSGVEDLSQRSHNTPYFLRCTLFSCITAISLLFLCLLFVMSFCFLLLRKQYLCKFCFCLT